MMNILNGGAHADTNVDFQEFMVMPVGAETFSDALRWGAEVFHTLKGVLKKKGYNTAVGDEGGFAPSLKSNEEALDLILEAITPRRLQPRRQTSPSPSTPPPASSTTRSPASTSSRSPTSASSPPKQMVAFWENWASKYPIVSIEDGLAEDDWDGWKHLTDSLGDSIQLVGDDLFVTNTQTPPAGHRAKGRQLHPHQGQPDRHRLRNPRSHRARPPLRLHHASSRHRSGETEDTFIADLAVATGAGQIKTGCASRTDRIAKYNQLLRIEEELGQSAEFLGIESVNFGE